MESRKYGLSAPGGDGKLPASGRKSKYYYDCMDRNSLYEPGHAVYFRQTGEFVVNLTTEKLAKATDYCGVRSGRDVDKFKEMHLTEEPSVQIHAPGIAECPVNIECRVKNILELGSHHMFVAEVLQVHVDESYLDEKGKFHLNDTGLMAYSHGEYKTLGETIGTFGYSVRKKRR